MQQPVAQTDLAFHPTIEHFLVDWGLQQKDFNSAAITKLNDIFAHLEQTKKSKDFKLQTEAAEDAFKELAVIGTQLGSRFLVKTAEAGNSLVKLNVGMTTITQQLGVTLPTAFSFLGPIAALHPALMVISAGLSLATLCGLGRRRRSKGLDLTPIMNGMKAIYGAVVEVHKEIIHVRQDINKLFEMVVKLGEFFIEDIKLPLIAALSSVDASLQRLHIVSGLEHRELFLQKLNKTINKFSEYEDGVITLKEKAIIKLLIDLHCWFATESCSSLLTGSVFSQTGVIGHEAQWIKQVLSNPNNNLAYVIGYLADMAQQLTGAKLPEVNTKLLMNIDVWSIAVSHYLIGLNRVNFENYHPELILKELVEQIDNYLKFIQFLSSSEALYKALFEFYKKSINGINHSLEKKFAASQTNLPKTLPNHALTFEELFPRDSGDRKELDNYLDGLNDFHLLFRAYTLLGGLTTLHHETVKQLLTQEKIFSYKDDFFNRNFIGPQWGNRQGFDSPAYYRTIRTTIFSLQEKAVFLGLVRKASGVTANLYDFSTQQITAKNKITTLQRLAGLPAPSGNLNPWPYGNNGSKDPINRNSIRVNVLNLNGQPIIFISAMHQTGCQLYSFNPSSNVWNQLPNSLLQGAINYQAVNLDICAVTIKNQPMLFLFYCTSSGLQLNAYNPTTKTWQRLCDLSTLKTNIHCAGGHVLEVDGQDKFYLPVISGENFEIHEYDPINDKWAAPFYGSIGSAMEYDFSTFKAQALTVNGAQILYLAVWHLKGLQLNVFDPIKKTVEYVGEGPGWNGKNYSAPQYKKTFQLQKILLNGREKLLAMVRHANGFEKHLFDPETKSWSRIANDWPFFKDKWGWNKEMHYATIQTNVVNISPEHQYLFISARHAQGLGCYQTKIEPLLFPTSSPCVRSFLQKIAQTAGSELKPINPPLHDEQPHQIKILLERIKTHSLFWLTFLDKRKQIAALEVSKPNNSVEQEEQLSYTNVSR